MENRNSYIQAIKYGITGVFGTVLYLLVLVLLVELLQVPPTLASFLAFTTTVGACFFINAFWTFNVKDASLRRFIKYSIVSVFGLMLTTTITYVGVDILHVWYVYCQIVVVLVVPLSNYLMNSLWVFSEPKTEEA